jgi:hypothetical protein
MDPDADPDLAIFVSDVNKVFLLITFEGTFTSFFKDKKSYRSHKTVGITFSYYFCMMIEESGSVSLTNDPNGEAQKHMDPTDPDPQHWSCVNLKCHALRLWFRSILFVVAIAIRI